MTGSLVLALQLSALTTAFAILYISQSFVIGYLLLSAPSRVQLDNTWPLIGIN